MQRSCCFTPPAALNDSAIIVVGGRYDTYYFSTSTYIYDVDADTWTKMADMPTGRVVIFAVLIPKNGPNICPKTDGYMLLLPIFDILGHFLGLSSNVVPSLIQ